MSDKTASGTVSEVLGQKLDTAISFTYSWSEYDDPAACKNAGAWPNDAEVLTYRNGIAQRNAMSAARAAAIKTEVARIQETPEFKLDKLVKDIIAAKPNVTQDDARKLAESILSM